MLCVDEGTGAGGSENENEARRLLAKLDICKMYLAIFVHGVYAPGGGAAAGRANCPQWLTRLQGLDLDGSVLRSMCIPSQGVSKCRPMTDESVGGVDKRLAC
jgi:hypothetical protein